MKLTKFNILTFLFIFLLCIQTASCSNDSKKPSQPEGGAVKKEAEQKAETAGRQASKSTVKKEEEPSNVNVAKLDNDTTILTLQLSVVGLVTMLSFLIAF